MSNTSATGGYLQPAASPAPLEGQSLDGFLQQVVALVVGMDGTLVRPRWQPEPANMPTGDWAALGVTRHVPDTYAYTDWDEPTQAYAFQRHENIEVLVSFYGPNAGANIDLLRDNLQIGQNREVLLDNGMGLVETGDVISAPEIIKQQWVMRKDMLITIRRIIQRVYPILTILSSQITLVTDEPPTTQQINVT